MRPSSIPTEGMIYIGDSSTSVPAISESLSVLNACVGVFYNLVAEFKKAIHLLLSLVTIIIFLNKKIT